MDWWERMVRALNRKSSSGCQPLWKRRGKKRRLQSDCCCCCCCLLKQATSQTAAGSAAESLPEYWVLRRTFPNRSSASRLCTETRKRRAAPAPRTAGRSDSFLAGETAADQTTSSSPPHLSINNLPDSKHVYFLGSRRKRFMNLEHGSQENWPNLLWTWE